MPKDAKLSELLTLSSPSARRHDIGIKDVLLQERNPDIEVDKTQVVSYLERVGFSNNLRQSLTLRSKTTEANQMASN